MSYEFIDLTQDNGVAVMRLNRPDNLNSWHQQMRAELRDAVAQLVADDALRVVVITGTGRAFSAGEDVRGMKGLADIGTRGFRRVVRDIHNVFDEVEAIEVPVIAAINGVAAGGGRRRARRRRALRQPIDRADRSDGSAARRRSRGRGDAARRAAFCRWRLYAFHRHAVQIRHGALCGRAS